MAEELNTRDKIVRLLDDYYGDSRDVSHKEEIANFVENYFEDLKIIMEE